MDTLTAALMALVASFGGVVVWLLKTTSAERTDITNKFMSFMTEHSAKDTAADERIATLLDTSIHRSSTEHAALMDAIGKMSRREREQ